MDDPELSIGDILLCIGALAIPFLVALIAHLLGG